MERLSIKTIHPSLTSLLLLSLLISSCRTVSIPPTAPTIKVPTTFASTTDSSSVGDLNWKAFFDDDNLVGLIDSALAHNPDLQLAVQRINVARANYDYTKGALRPSVNAVASAGVDRFGKYTMNGVGNFDTNFSDNISGAQQIPNPTPDYFLGVRSTWEVDLWGKLRNQRKAAYIRFLASDKGRHLVMTALVAEVARLYYTLLALDSEQDIIQENIQLQQKAVELVQVQKDAGRVTELAVQQFTAQLLNTQGLEVQIRQQIVAVENQLNLLLGRYPQPIARGRLIQEQTLPPQIKAGISAQMLRRRPDIRQAELEMEAAHIDVAIARAQFLPSLTLSPYVGLNSFRAAYLFNPVSLAAGILGGLSAPVFNRRFLKSNLIVSEAQGKAAFYGYQKVVLTGFSEVMTSLRGLDNYRQVAELQAKEASVLKQSVTISNELFRGGYAAYLEVITAQRSVLEAQLALINTKQAQFHSLIDLYRALGGGWQ